MTDNVYSQLSEIVANFQERKTLSRFELKPDAVRDSRFVQLNVAALAEARELLQRPCYVEVEFEYSFQAKHWQSELKYLPTALGLLFDERRGQEDFESCGQIGLDILRISQGLRRGGLIVDALIAIGSEGMAVDVLRKIRTKFSPDAAIALAAQIMRLEEGREPFAAIGSRDAEWERRVVYPPPSDPPPPEEPMQWSEEDIAEHGLENLRKMETATKELIKSFVEQPQEVRHSMHRCLDLSRLAFRRLLAVELAAQAYS